ncbi:MAG: sigma 54-interacting transcriptional regulator [Acidobacteriota bacterium]
MLSDDDWRDEETLQSTDSTRGATPAEEQVPGLTILAHTDRRRVGERVALPILTLGREVRLSRLEPVFQTPAGRGRRSLEDPSVSRRSLRLLSGRESGSVVLDRAAASTTALADGQRVEAQRIFSAAEIERGVVLQLGRRVVLLLHLLPVRPSSEQADLGLVGESPAIVHLRREMQRLAPLDVPVLLRGATGTGKELVARALHASGPRSRGPFVALNMAAMATTLAAAELFGARRGAYTGADRRKIGFFAAADGGTLFLDEIGETPPEVQPMLLRALETREVLPVGGVDPVPVDVRVIAATDAALEDAIAEGSFRAPLLHRLAGYTLRLPALTERRDDLGRLLDFFLQQELAEIGEAAVSASDAKRPWPPAEAVARLARHPWPGNVRELRNVARWMVITGRALAPDGLLAQLEKILGSVAVREPLADPPAVDAPREPARDIATQWVRRYRPAVDVDESELHEALESHGWRLRPTARALGVSRATLYRMIEASPQLRKPADLTRAEIQAALAQGAGDRQAAARLLQVSPPGLKRRMSELGLP